ncbi:putative LigA [Streptomyces misionensis JCM 4497]
MNSWAWCTTRRIRRGTPWTPCPSPPPGAGAVWGRAWSPPSRSGPFAWAPAVWPSPCATASARTSRSSPPWGTGRRDRFPRPTTCTSKRSVHESDYCLSGVSGGVRRGGSATEPGSALRRRQAQARAERPVLHEGRRPRRRRGGPARRDGVSGRRHQRGRHRPRTPHVRGDRTALGVRAARGHRPGTDPEVPRQADPEARRVPGHSHRRVCVPETLRTRLRGAGGASGRDLRGQAGGRFRFPGDRGRAQPGRTRRLPAPPSVRVRRPDGGRIVRRGARDPRRRRVVGGPPRVGGGVQLPRPADGLDPGEGGRRRTARPGRERAGRPRHPVRVRRAARAGRPRHRLPPGGVRTARRGTGPRRGGRAAGRRPDARDTPHDVRGRPVRCHDRRGPRPGARGTRPGQRARRPVRLDLPRPQPGPGADGGLLPRPLRAGRAGLPRAGERPAGHLRPLRTRHRQGGDPQGTDARTACDSRLQPERLSVGFQDPRARARARQGMGPPGHGQVLGHPRVRPSPRRGGAARRAAGPGPAERRRRADGPSAVRRGGGDEREHHARRRVPAQPVRSARTRLRADPAGHEQVADARQARLRGALPPCLAVRTVPGRRAGGGGRRHRGGGEADRLVGVPRRAPDAGRAGPRLARGPERPVAGGGGGGGRA